MNILIGLDNNLKENEVIPDHKKCNKHSPMKENIAICNKCLKKIPKDYIGCWCER